MELGCLELRSKLHHINSTVAANEAVVYYLVSHYEKKNEIDLITSGTCVTS